MRHLSKRTSTLLAAASFLFPLWSTAQTGQIRVNRVEVLPNPKLVEIEIQTSDRAVPQTQVLTSPDRLVVDFTNAVPGAQLRNQSVNRGQVKGLRAGLFAAKPPVTRIVVDLNGPQPYQIFPNGRSVIVKVGAASAAEAAVSNTAADAASMQAARLSPALSSEVVSKVASVPSVPSPKLAPTTNGVTNKFGVTNKIAVAKAIRPVLPVPVAAPVPQPPPLTVSFQGGLLSIKSERASLSEILVAVQQRTGADIAIPAGAEQEQVVAELGPAPAPEVLAHLLNGSKFNFLIISSSTKPGALDRVILSQRSSLLMPLPSPQTPTQIRPAQPPPDEEPTEPEVLPQAPPQPPQETPNPTQPPPTPPDR
jgi:hypothetical protein